MIRQAHNYLVGALSGVTLIGIAIAVFVVLVSAQVFHDWPVAALAGHSNDTAVAPAKALPTTHTDPAPPTATKAVSPRPVIKAPAATAAPTAKHARHHRAAPSDDATGPAAVAETAPEPIAAGDETFSGGGSGSDSSQPSSPTSSTSPAPSSHSPSSSGTSGSSSSSSSGSDKAGSNSSGSTGSAGSPGAPAAMPPAVAVPKPSEAVTETVNGTVGAVNEVTGGTLEKVGVNQVTEEVVNGVAGPESPVGKTVDGAGESLGRLLGGGEG